MRGRRLVMLWAALIAACNNAVDLPDEPSPDPVGEAVGEMFLQQFGESVPQPAFVNDSRVGSCTGASYLTAVAYLPLGSGSLMHVMHLTHNGMAPEPNSRGIWHYAIPVGVRPAGVFRVLTIVMTYPETVTDTDLPTISQTQAAINQQHAAFAQSNGYATPIVRFEFTNVTVPGTRGAPPKSLPHAQALLQAQGISTSGYHFVAVINIDPTLLEGGFASINSLDPPLFIYMGNYGAWSSRPTDTNFSNIASATYHHEVAHHWGWQHEWTPVCGVASNPWHPFITAPVLFGWLDTDADGVPEILDATPYGRGGLHASAQRTVLLAPTHQR